MRFPTPARVPLSRVVAAAKPRAENTSSAASRIRVRTSSASETTRALAVAAVTSRTDRYAAHYSEALRVVIVLDGGSFAALRREGAATRGRSGNPSAGRAPRRGPGAPRR